MTKYPRGERSRNLPRETIFCALFWAVFFFLGVAGCGSGGGENPAPQPTPTAAAILVSINPAAASVPVSKTLALTASVQNTADTRVLWRVEEGAAGGLVDSNGVYTAPGLAGIYHVSAVSSSDATRSATATITVVPFVRISPESATVSINGTQNFTAVIDGISDQRVTWSLREGSVGGSISDTGLYTAPANPGQFHIVAASVAQPQQTGEIVVTVKSGGTEVSIQ